MLTDFDIFRELIFIIKVFSSNGFLNTSGMYLGEIITLLHIRLRREHFLKIIFSIDILEMH